MQRVDSDAAKRVRWQMTCEASTVPTTTSTPGCTIVARLLASAVVFELSGELDLAEAGALRNMLVAATDGDRPLVRVLVDNLEFVDSAGLAALIAGANAANAAGCTFELVNPQPMVLRVLKVAGVVDALNVPVQPAIVEGPNSL